MKLENLKLHHMTIGLEVAKIETLLSDTPSILPEKVVTLVKQWKDFQETGSVLAHLIKVEEAKIGAKKESGRILSL